MIGTEQPAPGWYPDPHQPGTQRWWDGARWTEHTQAGARGILTDAAARNWAMAAHLSAIASAFVALGFLGPLVVYLVQRDQSPVVREHAAEALNFNLSMLLYGVIAAFFTFLLAFVLVGFFLLPLLGLGAIFWLAMCVVGGVKASQGELLRYPLTIRFLS